LGNAENPREHCCYGLTADCTDLQIDDFDVQERVLSREAAAGADHTERLAEIREKRAQVAASLAELKERFAQESIAQQFIIGTVSLRSPRPFGKYRQML